MAGDPIESCLRELERCVTPLGFRGCLLNPDPFETGRKRRRRWAIANGIHCMRNFASSTYRRISTPAGRNREPTPYTLHFVNEESIAVVGLVESNVFKDFPEIKIVISHGGSAIPYQIGLFQSLASRSGIDFLAGMRNLYFDAVLYSQNVLQLLIKTVGG